MPSIDIRRKHNRTMKDAKAAVDRLARQIADEFGVDVEWQGNTLAFSRSGVDGHIALSRGEVHVWVELGFLMGMMRSHIESEINRHLDEQIG